MLDPVISSSIVNASVDTSSFQTLLLVGQSNTATAGLYQDLEFLTQAQIDTKFGAGSHIAANLRDVISSFSNSIIKPKLWAASYADVNANTARILEATVTGTATKDCVLKLKINSLNPDRTSAKTASIAALRMTKGANCADFAFGNQEVGSPSLASNNFSPILAGFTDNDVIIEVNITSGNNATAIGAAIAAAIQATPRSLYSASASTGVVTLTSKHKGAIGNLFAVEVVPSSIKDAGFTIETLEDTAGAGVPDITGILNLENEEGTKLGELDFNLVALPYGYSETALVNDSYAKFQNVLNYANQCLEYSIFRGTAVSVADNSAINTVAAANPIEAKGVVKHVQLSALDGIVIRPIYSSVTSAYIKTKQLSPVQYDKLGINIGRASTLSDSPVFRPLSGFFSASTARSYVVEKKIKVDFIEKSYDSGISSKVSTYDRAEVLNLFEYYYDVMAGNKEDTIYGADYNGLIDSSERAKQNFLDALNLTFAFSKQDGQISMKAIYETIAPITSILYPQSFR